MLKTALLFQDYKKELRKKHDSRKKNFKTIKKACPLIQEPYDDSLCAPMLNQSIETAMYYCGSNFKKCGIYKKWS